MEIFYLKKSEILKSIKIKDLEYFSDGRSYSNQEKYIDHLLGLFLVKFIVKNVYNINEVEIEVVDKKPFLKSRKMYFSVSHSNDIVLVAFDNNNIGVDVEYVRERQNYQEILNRYGQKINNPSLTDFYRFWTLYESQIKLNNQCKSIISGYVEKDYMYSCVSGDIFITDNMLKEVVCVSENIDLEEEYRNPRNVKIFY